MANMEPYSAYSTENRQTTPMDMVVGGAVSTANYAYNPLTFTNPMLWNTQKGLYVPFATKGASYRQAASAIKGAFGKSAIRGIGQIGKSAVSLLTPFGGGSRVFGQESFVPKVANKSILNERMLRHHVRASKYWINNGELSSHYNTLAKRHGFLEFDKMAGSLKPFLNSRAIINEVSDISSVGATVGEKKAYNVVYNTGMNLANREARFVNKYNRISKVATKNIAKYAKLGIRLGRAASWAGAIMLTWDLAKMVGEPLGRLAVSEINNMATQWGNRYMPEMGGQLAMSYLTQGAATERQRALNAMSKAGISGRSSFGQESKFV